MLSYILIGIGGAIGVISRVVFTKVLPSIIYNLPLPIIIINIVGSFMIGILTAMELSENWKYFFIPGFLGGFTTFSSFALESNILMKDNHFLAAAIYISSSVFISLIACFFGIKFGKIFL